jgi:hypothetical protein
MIEVDKESTSYESKDTFNFNAFYLH